MNNAITTLAGEELAEGNKYIGTLAAPNGSVYGIPYTARRVGKFNPIDKSFTDIGPYFGNVDGYDEWKWHAGAMSDNGIIYCPPQGFFDRGILRIDTNTDNVTELGRNLLPEQGDGSMWISCAAALDGCIYFMPSSARRMMKLDPNNGDAMSSVGDDLVDGYNKYIGTVVGIDGCVYGIPSNSNRILKYDPINDVTSYVGEGANNAFDCNVNGASGRDGCIYALVNKRSRVLKIDTVNNSHCFVGGSFQSDRHGWGWGDAILGIDGCIYWPPRDAASTLKYDPHSNQTSLVGDDFGRMVCKWSNGALATDGIIYCIPSNAKQVLAIDPIGEFLETTKANMQEHPIEFGLLFQTNENYVPSLTNFDLAVAKFGQNTVFEVLEKGMKPINDYCKESNIYPFMIAASYKESPVCAIHHLLHRDVSWVHSCISSLEGITPKNKKRRIK